MIRVLWVKGVARLHPENVVDFEHQRLGLFEFFALDLFEINSKNREHRVEDDHDDREVHDAVCVQEGEVPGRENTHKNFPKHGDHVVPNDVVQKLLIIRSQLLQSKPQVRRE